MSVTLVRPTLIRLSSSRFPNSAVIPSIFPSLERQLSRTSSWTWGEGWVELVQWGQGLTCDPHQVWRWPSFFLDFKLQLWFNFKMTAEVLDLIFVVLIWLIELWWLGVSGHDGSSQNRGEWVRWWKPQKHHDHHVFSTPIKVLLLLSDMFYLNSLCNIRLYELLVFEHICLTSCDNYIYNQAIKWTPIK